MTHIWTLSVVSSNHFYLNGHASPPPERIVWWPILQGYRGNKEYANNTLTEPWQVFSQREHKGGLDDNRGLTTKELKTNLLKSAVQIACINFSPTASYRNQLSRHCQNNSLCKQDAQTGRRLVLAPAFAQFVRIPRQSSSAQFIPVEQCGVARARAKTKTPPPMGSPIKHHNCLLSDLAFEWQRGWRYPASRVWFSARKVGWRWPCSDKDLTVFVVETSAFTWQMKRGLYQSKFTCSLASILRPGHQSDNCRMAY